ncbi:hypothetical protein BJ742DRAFT_900628 [Cladochytrium replicatum]|nr:hypothetical protein BJ742DRAFT_900628 [Cladochytrium replicatum]
MQGNPNAVQFTQFGTLPTPRVVYVPVGSPFQSPPIARQGYGQAVTIPTPSSSSSSVVSPTAPHSRDQRFSTQTKKFPHKLRHKSAPGPTGFVRNQLTASELPELQRIVSPVRRAQESPNEQKNTQDSRSALLNQPNLAKSNPRSAPREKRIRTNDAIDSIFDQGPVRKKMLVRNGGEDSSAREEALAQLVEEEPKSEQGPQGFRQLRLQNLPSFSFKDPASKRAASRTSNAQVCKRTPKKSMDIRSEVSETQDGVKFAMTGPFLEIVDAPIWERFHLIQNEMIITKRGRCLFPTLRFRPYQMDPTTMYSISIDLVQVTPYRYRFKGGSWVPVVHSDGSPLVEAVPPPSEPYTHPESPQKGSYWIENGVCFKNLKLTNFSNGSESSDDASDPGKRSRKTKSTKNQHAKNRNKRSCYSSDSDTASSVAEWDLSASFSDDSYIQGGRGHRIKSEFASKSRSSSSHSATWASRRAPRQTAPLDQEKLLDFSNVIAGATPKAIPGGQFFVASFHMYQPRIHITILDDKEARQGTKSGGKRKRDLSKSTASTLPASSTQEDDNESVIAYEGFIPKESDEDNIITTDVTKSSDMYMLRHRIIKFDETAFVAVTHYQNPQVNHLKKNFNPHAKGFKDWETKLAASQIEGGYKSRMTFGLPSVVLDASADGETRVIDLRGRKNIPEALSEGGIQRPKIPLLCAAERLKYREVRYDKVAFTKKVKKRQFSTEDLTTENPKQSRRVSTEGRKQNRSSFQQDRRDWRSSQRNRHHVRIQCSEEEESETEPSPQRSNRLHNESVLGSDLELDDIELMPQTVFGKDPNSSVRANKLTLHKLPLQGKVDEFEEVSLTFAAPTPNVLPANNWLPMDTGGILPFFSNMAEGVSNISWNDQQELSLMNMGDSAQTNNEALSTIRFELVLSNDSGRDKVSGISVDYISSHASSVLSVDGQANIESLCADGTLNPFKSDSDAHNGRTPVGMAPLTRFTMSEGNAVDTEASEIASGDKAVESIPRATLDVAPSMLVAREGLGVELNELLAISPLSEHCPQSLGNRKMTSECGNLELQSDMRDGVAVEKIDISNERHDEVSASAALHTIDSKKTAVFTIPDHRFLAGTHDSFTRTSSSGVIERDECSTPLDMLSYFCTKILKRRVEPRDRAGEMKPLVANASHAGRTEDENESGELIFSPVDPLAWKRRRSA